MVGCRQHTKACHDLLAASCADVQPPPGADGISYSCAQQKEWGKCGFGFMDGYCQRTCGKCPPAPPPPGETAWSGTWGRVRLQASLLLPCHAVQNSLTGPVEAKTLCNIG